MTGLACTICARPSFARLRVEIAVGAATYLVCADLDCIAEATERAGVNLINAANRAVIAGPHPDAIDVAPAGILDRGAHPVPTIGLDR